jgi:hypothetical protein
MATYDHLPIYRDAMRLAVHVENTASRSHGLRGNGVFDALRLVGVM